MRRLAAGRLMVWCCDASAGGGREVGDEFPGAVYLEFVGRSTFFAVVRSIAIRCSRSDTVNGTDPVTPVESSEAATMWRRYFVCRKELESTRNRKSSSSSPISESSKKARLPLKTALPPRSCNTWST